MHSGGRFVYRPQAGDHGGKVSNKIFCHYFQSGKSFCRKTIDRTDRYVNEIKPLGYSGQQLIGNVSAGYNCHKNILGS
jgi:hypothetical protein